MENLKIKRAALNMLGIFRCLARMDNCEFCDGKKDCSHCENTGKSTYRLCREHAGIIQDITKAIFPDLFNHHFFRDPKGKLHHKICLSEVYETRDGTFCPGHAGDLCGHMKGTRGKPGWRTALYYNESLLFPDSS